MPVYKWEGRTLRGDMRDGVLRAEDELALRTLLRKDNVVLLKAKEQKDSLSQKSLVKRKVKPLSVVLFTRQLATMITSGLPLVQSLTILANQIEDKYLRAIVGEIKEMIEGGSRFADALRQYPKCFDTLYVNLVVAGEEGGNLDTVLNRLAAYMEKIEKLKKKIKSALIYPSTIIVVAIGVVLVLLLFVIPVFEEMFQSMGGALPAPTQFVINLSKFTKKYFPLMLGAFIVFIVLFKKYYGTKGGARKVDRLILKLPIFGMLILKSSVAKVTRTLATLLSSGVPILDSMEIVSKVAGNTIVEDSIIVAKSRVTEGKSMSEPLEESGIFPAMVVQMVHVGETTGSLDSMLNKIADFYEDDVDNMVGNLTSLLEPAIMVFLGVVLGSLLIAMYLPIFKIGEAVG